MLLEKYGGNNNFIIWVLLFIIAFGFGKGSECLGLNCFSSTGCNDNHSGKGHKDSCCYPQAIPVFGNQMGKGFFGGNGIFILLIIALLFLCKEDRNETNKDDQFGCEE